MRQLLLDTHGDTIVEVLIAIVILALILTGAYSSADRSLNTITEAGQRTIAVDIAQNQIEDLRSQAATSSMAALTNTDFCFDTSNNQPVDDPPATPSSQCVSQNIYTSAITYLGLSPNADAVGVHSYKITVSWPSFFGGNSDVVLFYRVAT